MENQDSQIIKKQAEFPVERKFVALIVLVVFIFIGLYFTMNYYFKNKVQFRTFEECLSVVSDPFANWITRKGTVDYCKEQVY